MTWTREEKTTMKLLLRESIENKQALADKLGRRIKEEISTTLKTRTKLLKKGLEQEMQALEELLRKLEDETCTQ